MKQLEALELEIDWEDQAPPESIMVPKAPSVPLELGAREAEQPGPEELDEEWGDPKAGESG